MKPLDEGQAAYYGLANLMFLLSKKGIITLDEASKVIEEGFKGLDGIMETAKREGAKK